MKQPYLIFVGQGPNQASWEDAIKRGRNHYQSNEMIIQFAEDFSRRIALTGSVGKKLALLLGESLSDFRQRPRHNLNARWNGKRGKGDKFDLDEGRQTAMRLIDQTRIPNARFVLLGQEVVRAFHMTIEPLRVGSFRFTDLNTFRFFHLPHPSGLNRWWNDVNNRAEAHAKLAQFVYEAHEKNLQP